MATQTRARRGEDGGTAIARQTAPRGALSRARIMAEALKLVDRNGLEALSMRRLGAELGVEAMSLYRYVDGKEELLDGVSAQLWSEVRLPEERASAWKVTVRETARTLRGLARAHPNSFSLLLGRPTLAEPALRVLDALLRTFHAAGFDDALASRALGSFIAYALGYAMIELTCGLGQPELAAQRCISPEASTRFTDVARAFAECNPEAQFDFGLDTLLKGLEAERRKPGRRAG